MADFPDICPDDETLGLEANNQIFESVLTGQTQTAQLTGDKWSAQPSFSNRYGTEAKTLQAFIFGLGGMRGTFNYSPFSIDQQGTMSGNGVVDGAGQTGSVLNTKGWDFNQPDLFKIGDYLSFNGELKIVTGPVELGSVVSYPDTTNLMPSPFDPSGWVGASDPDGNITNVAISNPSGQSFAGLAEQVGSGFFFLNSASYSATTGDIVSLCLICKEINFLADIEFNFAFDSNPNIQGRFNCSTGDFAGNPAISTRSTDLGDGFILLETLLEVPYNDNMDARFVLFERGASLPPIGSQIYVQASFFGLTQNFPSSIDGIASIPITPPIRVSPADNNAIETTKPFFVGRLEDDDQARVSVSSPIIYNATFSIKEAF